MIPRDALRRFISESNAIEGIRRPPTDMEVAAHVRLLDPPALDLGEVERFVLDVANASLRRSLGMDVRVGNHFPPPGGPEMETDVNRLLAQANMSGNPWAIHVRYELLHPFMDGNGRSGRAIWAWQMRRLGRDPFALTFLEATYYQALDAARGDR